MNEKNIKRIKGLIAIIVLSIFAVFFIWKIIPPSKFDIELLSVDITNQITEGENTRIVINLKNNSTNLFKSSLHFKWIPDPEKGTPILIELPNIQILGNSTYSLAIDKKIQSSHISRYEKFILNEFVISGDQNDKNNLVTKEISYYKKSRTNPIIDVLPPNFNIPNKPFVINYILNGKMVSKKFKNYSDLKTTSIPKNVEMLKIDGKETVNRLFKANNQKAVLSNKKAILNE